MLFTGNVRHNPTSRRCRRVCSVAHTSNIQLCSQFGVKSCTSFSAPSTFVFHHVNMFSLMKTFVDTNWRDAHVLIYSIPSSYWIYSFSQFSIFFFPLIWMYEMVFMWRKLNMCANMFITLLVDFHLMYLKSCARFQWWQQWLLVLASRRKYLQDTWSQSAITSNHANLCLSNDNKKIGHELPESILCCVFWLAMICLCSSALLNLFIIPACVGLAAAAACLVADPRVPFIVLSDTSCFALCRFSISCGTSTLFLSHQSCLLHCSLIVPTLDVQ